MCRGGERDESQGEGHRRDRLCADTISAPAMAAESEIGMIDPARGCGICGDQTDAWQRLLGNPGDYP